MDGKIYHLTQSIIIDPRSPYDQRKGEFWINNGVLSLEDPAGDEEDVIHYDSVWLMPGMIDVGVTTGEPGFEYREHYQSIQNAARFTGVMDVVAFPDGMPVADRSPLPNSKWNDTEISLHFLGAISQKREGKEMAELFDLKESGVKGFSDGRRSLQDAALLKKAFEYTKHFGIPVCNRPEDSNIAFGGRMHEGNHHVYLGLKGVPSLAETLMLQRDIELLRYTGGHYHALAISSAASVDLIKKAKADGLSISASVNIMNLILTDEALSGFDANLKLSPPLRDDTDRLALIQGLKEGVIDMIRSDHSPFSPEEKEVEFEYAPFGSIQLQTWSSAYCTYLKDIFSPVEWVFHTCIKPAEIFSIPRPIIQPGHPFTGVLYNPDHEWVLQNQTNLSLSKNTWFWGKKMKGKAIQIFRNHR